MTVAPLRINRIEIKGLFRQYHHVIPLNLEEHVTILHGRNGVGKTVTLSLVAALLQGNYAKLLKVPFELLRVEFTDGSVLEAIPINVEQQPVRRLEKSKGILSIATHSSRVANSWTELIQQRIKPARLELRFSLAGTTLTSITVSEDGLIAHVESENDIAKFKQRMLVHFIEAQRLFKIIKESTIPNPQSPYDSVSISGISNLLGELSSLSAEFESDPASAKVQVTASVKEIQQEIVERIKQTDSKYRAISTRLDNSLPARMFDPKVGKESLALNELSRRVKALEMERDRLREIGLVADASSFDVSSLSDTQSAMFAVYLKDNEEKLGVFKDLADRSEILLRIINHKFSPKHVKLDKDKGYQAFSHDGQSLELDLLSSGEQHELVLLHNLLFRVEAGALLLIDEPELSLHVTWQSEFLKDLIEIAKTVGFDALVATHSPYIVGDRRDLAVQLGQPE